MTSRATLTTLFLLALAGLSTPLKAQKNYTIEIVLPYAQEKVWEVITEFDTYPRWNTVLQMENNDSLVIGKKFNVTITNENGKTSKFNAKTLSKNEPSSFAAQQRILGKWFFSATHHFILSDQAPNQTLFIQKWEFTGILFPLAKKAIFKQLHHFNQMNADLSAYLAQH